MSKGAQIAIGAAAIAALLGWYGVSQLGDGLSFQYFQNLDEFHASGTTMVGRSARVHGYVANGTAEHIKITLAGMAWIDDGFSGSAGSPAETSCQLVSTYDGTNAPAVVTINSAIT